MAKAVIVSATRTAIGTLGGALAQQPATKLGAIAVREAIKRAKIADEQVDEVILGHVLTAGLGLNPARVAAMESGLPKETTAFAVNKACGSGLKAAVLAAQAVVLGDADIIVAGGMESMSGAPYITKKARFGIRMGHEQLLDSMIADGLTCPITHVHMGITAENVAAKYELSREEQDEFAAESQQRAVAAIEGGKFKAEIVPVEVPGAKKGETFTFDTDEHPRRRHDGRAKPPAGGLQAGRWHGHRRQRVGHQRRRRRRGDHVGCQGEGAGTHAARHHPQLRLRRRRSAIMGMGPWPSSEKALQKAGIRKEEIDLWELNEAFAAQSLGVLRELNIPKSRVNVNGGAIALGHPIGASGARVLVTLLYAMADRDARLGVASLCIGGGQGIAMVIERA